MFMNLLSIAIILGLGYLWVTRGFFSALLHLACVIAAGAIAFGLWETVALAILNKAPQTGFLSFAGDAAWGLGLALPFAISLALLRVLTDKIAPSNIIVEETYDSIGGGICGAGIGLITSGMFVLSTGFLRLPASFMGYQPVQMANQGNLEWQGGLWLPVDKLTAAFYNTLSQNTLATSTPLVRYYPDLAAAAGTQRMSEGNGKNKNTIREDGFDVQMRFTVGKSGSLPADQVFSDIFNPAAQQITLLDGSQLPAGSYIEGFLINFLAGAKENFGQVVVGKGQLRLIAHNRAGEGVTLYPIAVTSQARSEDRQFGRFRFDGEFYVASVGGATEAPMAFEFAVPAGYEATALYVRNLRHELAGAKADREFADASARDIAIQTGELLVRDAAANLNFAHAQTINSAALPEGVDVTNRMANRVVLQRGNTPGLQTDDDNKIVSGEGVFNPSDVGGRGLDRNLRVDQFATTKDTAIIQIQITGDPAQFATSYFNPSAAPDLRTDTPPRIVDANGQAYNAVGFIYQDINKVRIRYTPGRPMMGLGEADALVRSRDDQVMYLIFRPSIGVELKHFAIGDTVLATFEPGLVLEAPRR